MLLNLDLSEKYRFQLPISTRKNDALLMLYRTEMLDLLPPDALLLLILSIKKGISDRAPWVFQERIAKRKVRKMACSSRFSDFWVWQGQKDLNPRHAVLEWRPKGFICFCRCERFVIILVFKPFSGRMSEWLTVSQNSNKHQINTKQFPNKPHELRDSSMFLRGKMSAESTEADRWFCYFFAQQK